MTTKEKIAFLRDERINIRNRWCLEKQENNYKESYIKYRDNHTQARLDKIDEIIADYEKESK